VALSKIPNYLQDTIDSDAIGAGAITTSKIPDNAVTPDKVSPTLMSWEHIQTRVSASDGDTTNFQDGSSKIFFPDVFTSDYIFYKLIIGWLGNTTSNGADVRLRYLTSGTTEQTSDYYYGSQNINTAESSGLVVNTNITRNTSGLVWKDLWKDILGGVHGEINFYNMRAPVINGINVDRGDSYRPYCEGTLIGYDIIHGYSRGTFHIRYNVTGADDAHTGFVLYNSESENWRAGCHMSLYGLKVPV
jgi:hypothetical protein